jgi:hypothetical protein
MTRAQIARVQQRPPRPGRQDDHLRGARRRGAGDDIPSQGRRPGPVQIGGHDAPPAAQPAQAGRGHARLCPGADEPECLSGRAGHQPAPQASSGPIQARHGHFNGGPPRPAGMPNAAGTTERQKCLFGAGTDGHVERP